MTIRCEGEREREREGRTKNVCERVGVHVMQSEKEGFYEEYKNREGERELINNEKKNMGPRKPNGPI